MIVRVLAPIVKAHGLTAFEVVNTHECSRRAGKAQSPLRRRRNEGRGSLSAQVLLITEAASDMGEAETRGSQSAFREKTVFPLKSQFSLMERILSQPCSDGLRMPWA